MGEIILLERLQGIYSGDPWYGPNICESIEAVEETAATWRVPLMRHNIAELVRHMANWQLFAARKLQGDQKYEVRLNTGSDWSQIDALNKNEWIDLKQELLVSQSLMLQSLQMKSSQSLDDQVPGHRISFSQMLMGIADHNIYHLGQINMIRSAFERLNLSQSQAV